MKKTLVILLLLINSVKLFAQNDADKLIGTWLTDEKDARIEIVKKGDKYYGKIIWLKIPNNPNGSPKLDIKNPDPKLRTRAILGLNLLNDFVYAGDNVWKDGKIYDGRSGKMYSCKMTLAGNDLKVRGFVGVSLFGKTSVWTRFLQ